MPVRSNGNTTDADVYRVGIYGWRKRCLYCFVLLLTILIVVNLALTVWIMKVMNFHLNGMGGLTIHGDTVRVDGKAEFPEIVYFKNITAGKGEQLNIDSERGILFNARDGKRPSSARLYVGKNQAQAVCNRFEIYNDQEKLMFYTDENEAAVKVKNLRIIGDGGSTFEGSVQTKIIRPESDNTLRLESPTRDLKVSAMNDINIDSRAGGVQINSFLNIGLESSKGEIRLKSKNVVIEGLETSKGRGSSQFQLCACRHGRLFLARNGADCRASHIICNRN